MVLAAGYGSVQTAGDPVAIVGGVPRVKKSPGHSEQVPGSDALPDVQPRRRAVEPSTETVLREELDRKSLLLDVLEHELRSGLAAISGFADLLRDREHFDAANRERFVSRIAINAEHLTDIVTNAVDLERVAVGAVEVRRRLTNLSELIQQVVEGLDLAGHPIDVTVERSFAFVDPFLVERIVENLINNSIRHTPAGTYITITVEGVPSGIQLTVADDGPGVPDELREVLFERLRRGISDRRGGAGLGLYIVKRFAELHDGAVWLGHGPDGASFHVVVSTDPGVAVTPPGTAGSIGASSLR